MNLHELASKLVGFDTVSCKSNIPLTDFVSKYCKDYGFVIEEYPYSIKGVKKKNIIARKGGFRSRLCFSGHTDTVPFSAGEWNTNPLELTEVNGKYYGMGIADMKLFLAIAMKVGEVIDEKDLKKPFSICFTGDEEVGCLGAKKLTRQNIHLGDMVLIGEPTELIPLNLHKGYMFIRIVLKGQTGHASIPSGGKSVVHQALPLIIQEVDKFQLLLRDVRDSRFNPDYPTMNVGVVTTDKDDKKSGKNLISDFCKIELEIRPVPGQEPEELFFAFKKYLHGAVKLIDGVDVDVQFARAPSLPMETDKDSEIAKTVVDITGNSLSSVCFNTEGGVFNKAGCESIICGPGSINQAHKANEFVDSRFFADEVVNKYIEVVRRICC